MKLGPGTLYGSIKRMLESDLIEDSGDRPDPELDDDRRKYYRLTKQGRQVASAEATRLDRQVQQARNKELLGPAFKEPNRI